jgi:geranylgeranyl pyrophosphate synthase
MLTRLLEATSPLLLKLNVRDLTTVLGRCYALRDDYKNISSAEVSEPSPVPTKGFCEDLDEGKFSLPIIHALNALTEGKSIVLRNILTQRRISGSLTLKHKVLVLELLAEAGSLPYTLDALRLLQNQVDVEMDQVEADTAIENYELRALFEMIKV